MESVGPYRIVKELGRGAMGVVFEAFDPAIGRTVALKVIRPQPLATAEENAQLKLRFAREASAAGRLSHPNIVTIHQLGEHDGMQYLVMEYIAGASLESVLAPASPLTLDAALAILTQIAAALDYAHSQGIVHRDVKPTNILVKPDGVVKLTDFGIAHITSQVVTHTGATMGTPAYMAPEQIMASRVDGRADQYSLAVVAYQMLAGRRPFDAPTDQALMFKIVSEKPGPLDQANPFLPRVVAEVVRRGLSKHPGERYPSCAEFVAAIRTAAAPVAMAHPPPAEPRRPTAPGPPRGGEGRRRVWPVIVACALLAAGAAAWLGFRAAKVSPGRDNPPAPETTVNPKDGLTYVWIPPGRFMMGCSPGDTECFDDEKPARSVEIPSGFWLGQTPVTQQAYQRVTGQSPSHFKGANRPVETVSWDEAQSYCQAIGGRLPTEAEWEYAARAGSTGARYGNLDDIAWYSGNSGGQTHEVGQKQPNAWGLFDMLGNVWQWTADWFVQGSYRSLRGGSWGYGPGVVRVSYRGRGVPGYRLNTFGFRCVGE